MYIVQGNNPNICTLYKVPIQLYCVEGDHPNIYMYNICTMYIEQGTNLDLCTRYQSKDMYKVKIRINVQANNPNICLYKVTVQLYVQGNNPNICTR